ncbi:Fe2+-dependent dioxygenase [Nioella nitratireducens]|uniref:Fe2+-dependent dioxygenase n=1 Tax=Nioella nitratireducens TaxID=1287720 RepID=UPI0008FD4DF5|nr:Fe2+-dependent dioxygenase [Nioella nitratireducens]
MFHLIDGVFDAPTVAALRAAVAELDFEDGHTTAGPLARLVKNNAQAAPSPDRDAVLKKVERTLWAHPGFQSVARPRAVVRLLISAYAGGQAYGTHVDDALMAGARTDVSFTIPLTAPDAYEGGALVVQDRVEERGFKPEPGQAIVYPSDTLHRVEPVTEGQRVAIVGWVTSWVRDPAKRDILFDLDESIAAETARGADPAQLLRLSKTRSNLLRMWAG